MTTNSSLPLKAVTKRSDDDVRLFFDRYYTRPIQVASNDLDSVVGFFEKRGFDKSAATAVAVTLLNQAKLDNVPIFKLLQTLDGLEELKLSVVVAEVLNYNRKKTSRVGFKKTDSTVKTEARNIIV